MRALMNAAILLGAISLAPLTGPQTTSASTLGLAAVWATSPPALLSACGHAAALALQAGPSPDSAPGARKKDAKEAVSAKESAAMRRRARRAIETGDLRRAARLLRQAAGVKKLAERQAWLLLRAELACAKKNYPRAGLAAMRLVILHPRSGQAGNALYWAGRAYEGLERPHQAAALYDECLAHELTKASIRNLAQARQAALPKQVSTR